MRLKVPERNRKSLTFCHFPSLFQGIIHLLTSKKSQDFRQFQHLYGMRMINTVTREEAWLHQDTTMFQVQECIRNLQEKSIEPTGEWKFELRIRYLPLEWTEVYESDNLTFMSYYNQVLNFAK